MRRRHKIIVSLVYDIFDGHTYYVHNVLHNVFAYVDSDREVGEVDINNTIDNILDERESAFSSVINQLNYQQKETLIAIAKEGGAIVVTSVAFVKKS